MTPDISGSHARPAPSTSSRRPARLWSPGPWLPLLLLLVIAFIAFSVPPYLSLDTARSRIPPPEGRPAYYPLLVAHVVFASVAMATAFLQIWPWFRQRYPSAHRVIGRVYVLAGVLPAGIAGLLIGAISPFGPVIRGSNVLLALVWLTCTMTGFSMARRGRFIDHRRWMTRSVVLTMSIITNRIWAVVFTIALAPQLATTFAGNEALMVQTIAGLSGWLGWVIPLLVAEWWILTPSQRSSSALVVATSTLSATPSAASPTDA